MFKVLNLFIQTKKFIFKHLEKKDDFFEILLDYRLTPQSFRCLEC